MTAPDPERPGPGRLLVGACGAAAITMLPNYLIAMKTEVGCHVTVLLTAAAERFLPARTIGLFADETISGEDADLSFAKNHVQLAAEHDLILVLPATAHILAAAASGQASGQLALTVLAARGPVIFVPSMNRVMWAKRAVQRNVAQLRDDGHEVIDPDWPVRFELATRQMLANPSLPAPKLICALVRDRLAIPVPGRVPASGSARSPAGQDGGRP